MQPDPTPAADWIIILPVIMPLIGWIFGEVDFANWFIRLGPIPGDYELVDTTNDPVNNTQSANVSDAQCPDTNWYKARAIKEGWPPGPFSTPDEGCWNL